MQTTIRMYGEVAGNIWMPAAECTKEFDVRLERVARNAETMTAYSHGWPMQIRELRDALLTITNDGDFQSCNILWATLEVTRIKSTSNGQRKITRVWSLKGAGYNADCFAQA